MRITPLCSMYHDFTGLNLKISKHDLTNHLQCSLTEHENFAGTSTYLYMAQKRLSFADL